ncbi:MAG TPA: hypothetical protein DDZ51_27900 [Planctomycetaceae bacterium]|nr:hypothetical protein [Planctomycetaceae bacterium]
MLEPQELNAVAAKAASSCREARAIEQRHAELLMQVSEQEPGSDGELMEQLRQVEREKLIADKKFAQAFSPLWEVIHTAALIQTRKSGLKHHLVDEFAQDATLHVRRRICAYQDGNFGGWLYVTLFRLMLSMLRPRGSVNIIGLDEVINGSAETDAAPQERSFDAEAVRTALKHFLGAKSPKCEYKYLFVFSSQLWFYLDSEQARQWPAHYRPPSEWEQSLSSLFRCNQVALDWAECRAAQEYDFGFGDAKMELQDQETFFHDRLRMTRQSIAQNLNRYYTCLLAPPPLFDYLLRTVPLSKAISENAAVPSRLELAYVLQFDAWVGLPGDVWGRWIDAANLRNSMAQNLARLLAVPTFDADQGTLNQRKFALILDWLCDSTQIVDDAAPAADVVDPWPLDQDGIHVGLGEMSPAIQQLLLFAPTIKRHLDLPVPFRKLENDEINLQQEATS